MRYLALASDYDGTLAEHGQLAATTRAGLLRLRASGRKVILVTGREMIDLEQVCPELALFDRIVSENGAVVFNPATRQERLLAAAPPASFVAELRRRGGEPLYLGRVIVATRDEHDELVRQVIAEQNLDLEITLNKGALMILPAGVDKGVGLRAALDELQIAPRQTVGVGDAENDAALLTSCGCRVAVGNALPMLKAIADWVTTADAGAGVVELIERLLRDDLAGVADR